MSFRNGNKSKLLVSTKVSSPIDHWDMYSSVHSIWIITYIFFVNLLLTITNEPLITVKTQMSDRTGSTVYPKYKLNTNFIGN
jgi:hypothetical protein